MYAFLKCSLFWSNLMKSCSRLTTQPCLGHGLCPCIHAIYATNPPKSINMCLSRQVNCCSILVAVFKSLLFNSVMVINK